MADEALSTAAAVRKSRGAFFTPPQIARFLADWAIRSHQDTVLEPSCGEAAFLAPAAERLVSLGASRAVLQGQLFGVDIHAESVELARATLAATGVQATIQTEDFFERTPEPVYDAVVGNPPYVRFQTFAGDARARALEAAFRQGVRLTQLASSWAAFTVHASAFLKPEGRLALVLPAELLAVKYAGQIRRFLLNRFKSVRLVLFESLVFPGVLEEVVLLLAEGRGTSRSFEVFQARNADELVRSVPANWVGFTPRGDAKWTSALLPSDAIALYHSVAEGAGFEVMLDWGETYLGAVTGNNDYFALTRSDVARLKLCTDDVIRISPPGSRHLKGLSLSESAWEKLAAADERCFLFMPKKKPSKAAQRYIEYGETRGVHKAYKCTVRTPWWRVPLAERPDLLFTYMSHDRPRVIRNGAGVQVLNSLYGVKLNAARRALGEELLALASLNSMTLLGAEVVGRSYGGGMLKHEPTEVDLLPLPSVDVLEATAPRLRLMAPQVGALMHEGDVSCAVDLVDRVLLRDHLKLDGGQISLIRLARDTLMHRRHTRAKPASGKN